MNEKICVVTTAQRRLAKALRKHGVHIQENCFIMGGEADIAIPELKLIIEVDGFTHLSIGTRLKDKSKDKVWKNSGYHVFRFSNYQVLNRTNDCVKQITDWIYSLKKAQKVSEINQPLKSHNGLRHMHNQLLREERRMDKIRSNESVEAFFLRCGEQEDSE